MSIMSRKQFWGATALGAGLAALAVYELVTPKKEYRLEMNGTSIPAVRLSHLSSDGNGTITAMMAKELPNGARHFYVPLRDIMTQMESWPAMIQGIRPPVVILDKNGMTLFMVSQEDFEQKASIINQVVRGVGFKSYNIILAVDSRDPVITVSITQEKVAQIIIDQGAFVLPLSELVKNMGDLSDQCRKQMVAENDNRQPRASLHPLRLLIRALG